MEGQALSSSQPNLDIELGLNEVARQSRAKNGQAFWNTVETDGVERALLDAAERASNEAELIPEPLSKRAKMYVDEQVRRANRSAIFAAAADRHHPSSSRKLSLSVQHAVDTISQGGDANLKLEEVARCLTELRLGHLLEDCLAHALSDSINSSANEFSHEGTPPPLADILDFATTQARQIASTIEGNIDEWERHAKRTATEAVESKLLDSIFDLIADHPASAPSLDDLANCLAHTSNTDRAARKCVEAVKRRLLHPGADTSELLTGHVQSHRSLLRCDPSGILWDATRRSIESYLARSADSQTQIAEALLSGEGEVAEEIENELREASRVDGNEGIGASGNEACDEHSDIESAINSWKPQPWSLVWEEDGGGRGDGSESDNGYGLGEKTETAANWRARGLNSGLMPAKKSEGVLEEMRTFITRRAISGRKGWSQVREVEVIELLRKKFGASMLHPLEVMTQDIEASRRVHYLLDCPRWFDLLVMSKSYWQQIDDETHSIALPKQICKQLSDTEQRFKRHKAPRSLKFIKSAGFATVNVELNGESRDLSLSIVDATLLVHMSNSKTTRCTATAMSKAINVPLMSATKSLHSLVSKGVLEKAEAETGTGEEEADEEDWFQVRETLKAKEEQSDEGWRGREEGLEDVGNGGGQRSQRLEKGDEIVNGYVRGMLEVHGGCYLDRIFNMLSMFVEGGFNMSKEELSSTLHRLVNCGKLRREGSLFKPA